ncbi:MAG: hypothetical protein QMD23_03755 [Candidatus Bathyarchaeia archaeon]|nr:hypothetical protein [Candidatus Bathyarchaeia archaeon]
MQVGQKSQLAPWLECIGKFLRLEVCGSEVTVVLLCRNEQLVLSFPKGSKEAEAVLKKLGQCPPRTTIGILKTDDLIDSLRIRLID